MKYFLKAFKLIKHKHPDTYIDKLPMNDEKKLEIQYLSKESDNFYVEKKIKLHIFILKELFVFSCITAASYFSIFISSQKFATEESFSKSFNLVFEFFTIENLVDTSLGLFIVMGILSLANHMLTDSKLNIQPILIRLSQAIIDFYYLMFSTILGCMLGLFYFLNKFPTIDDYEKLHNLALQGIITIGIVGTTTAITIQFLMNQNKILK